MQILQAMQLINGAERLLDGRYYQWRYYYSSYVDKVYHRIPAKFETYSRNGIRGPRGRQPIFNSPNISLTLPVHSHCATYSSPSTKTKLVGWTREEKFVPLPPSPPKKSYALMGQGIPCIVTQY